MIKAKLYKACYAAILISVFVGCYFLFNHLKKQSDLNDYYYQELEKCHEILLNPCKRLITDALKDFSAKEWMEIQAHMLEDGYTRAEVAKMNKKIANRIMKKNMDLGDKFWKDMDEKYGK